MRVAWDSVSVACMHVCMLRTSVGASAALTAAAATTMDGIRETIGLELAVDGCELEDEGEGEGEGCCCC